MAELTTIIVQECSGPWECRTKKWPDGCWPYKKSMKGGRVEYGTCKHVCQWHSQFSREVQTEEQKKNMICPKCSGKTRSVLFGV